jgi:hypothetical protein
MLLKIVILHLFINQFCSQNLIPYVNEIGGTFCRFLAYKSQLPRNYLRDCVDPTCAWSDWNKTFNLINSFNSSKRIVLSYAHNGFGNQLWQHSVAFMISESLKAKMLIAIIPDQLSPGYVKPENTWAGMDAMKRLLSNNLFFENLHENSTIKKLCENEHFFVSDRPIDWRDKNYSTNFKSNLINLLSDKNPRCLKLLGYFQNLPLCYEDIKQLWTQKLFQNFTNKPNNNDISIYLRCLPRHYHFNDKLFYETILNNTKYDKVWLFQSPNCPTKLSENPQHDRLVSSVIRLLKTKYNATKFLFFYANTFIKLFAIILFSL